MRRSLRFVLMWLLALALPLQGMAAATMLHCQPAGHGGEHAQHAMHQHDGSAHAHAADGHLGAVQAIDALGAAIGDCSACASCCTAAGLPAAPLIIAPQAFAQSLSVLAPPAVPVFETDGPERPPRRFLV